MNPWYLTMPVLAIDLVVGDPAWLTHPVVLMGRLVRWLELRFLRDADSPARKVICGFALWLIVVASAYGVTWAAIWLVARVSPQVALALNLWLCSTTVAANGLARAGARVRDRLVAGDVHGARQAVAEIVGRDTQHLDEPELVRAAVESVAENTVDGVVSPLVYAALGSAPLAMAYRAINTMDSMLGYRDQDYLYFGRAAARLDDVANYLPARLAGVLLTVAAAVLGLNWRSGLKVWVRDAPRHPSPNAGVPESVVAGSLGLRLGGVNYYDGQPRSRATMGDATRAFEVRDIDRTIRMMILASAVGAIVFAATRWSPA